MDSHAVVVGRLPGIARRVSAAPEAPVAPSAPSRPSRVLRRLGKVLLNLVFLAMMACVAIMLVPAVLGFHRYIILTGSMTGTYDRGSIVYDRLVPTSSLKVGDPITYSPPPGFTSQARVSHRIWSIHRGPNGERVFRTKGDANKHVDIWKFTLNKPMQDKVIFHVPEVGYVFLLLSLRNFRIALVGVPTVIIGLVMLRRLWREAGEEAKRQKLAEQGWRTLVDTGSGFALPAIDQAATEHFPARLDLRLRQRAAPVRSSTPSRPAPAATRSRIDLNLPLRLKRLTSAPLLAAAARSPIAPQRPAASASIATVRLLVTRAAIDSGQS